VALVGSAGPEKTGAENFKGEADFDIVFSAAWLCTPPNSRWGAKNDGLMAWKMHIISFQT